MRAEEESKLPAKQGRNSPCHQQTGRAQVSVPCHLEGNLQLCLLLALRHKEKSKREGRLHTNTECSCMTSKRRESIKMADYTCTQGGVEMSLKKERNSKKILHCRKVNIGHLVTVPVLNQIDFFFSLTTKRSWGVKRWISRENPTSPPKENLRIWLHL